MTKTLREACEESHDGRHWALTRDSILAALDAERAAGRREALEEVRAWLGHHVHPSVEALFDERFPIGERE